MVRTRAEPLGVEVVVGDHATYAFTPDTFGALIQYPTTDGDIFDYDGFCRAAHEAGALVVVAADLLALTLLRAPGEFGADIVVGNSQRFGVPMGYGGPHAAFMATREEHKRLMPGRLIGVSIDAQRRPGAAPGAADARAAHSPRQGHEQYLHGAGAAGDYGLDVCGLSRTGRFAPHCPADAPADRHPGTPPCARPATQPTPRPVFDTLKISAGPRDQAAIRAAAEAAQINLRYYEDGAVGVALDEATTVSRRRRAAGPLRRRRRCARPWRQPLASIMRRPWPGSATT